MLVAIDVLWTFPLREISLFTVQLNLGSMGFFLYSVHVASLHCNFSYLPKYKQQIVCYKGVINTDSKIQSLSFKNVIKDAVYLFFVGFKAFNTFYLVYHTIQVILLGKFNAQGLGNDYEILLRVTKGNVYFLNQHKQIVNFALSLYYKTILSDKIKNTLSLFLHIQDYT